MSKRSWYRSWRGRGPSPTFLILAWDLKIQGSNLTVDFFCLKMAKITPFILVTGVTFLQNGEKMLLNCTQKYEVVPLREAAQKKSGLTLELWNFPKAPKAPPPPYFGPPVSTFQFNIFYILFYHPTHSEGSWVFMRYEKLSTPWM